MRTGHPIKIGVKRSQGSTFKLLHQAVDDL
jgi:hypothetical protein